MRPKKLGLVTILLLLALPLFSASAAAGPALVTDQSMVWGLTETTVLSTGTTVTTPQGTITRNFTFEATVKAKNTSLMSDAILRVTLSAFSPKKDMAGQKAGKWYVQGIWTLTAKNADPVALKARHNPYVAEGLLQAVLGFNPAAVRSNWTAKIVLPMSLLGGRWSRGEGTLTLNPALQGDLFLQFIAWPEAR